MTEPPRIEHEGYVANARRKHLEFFDWLHARGDAYSIRLAETTPNPLEPGLHDANLVDEDVLAEMSVLAAKATPLIRQELIDALSSLKADLAMFDPLPLIAAVSLRETFAPWGTYYEPAEERSEVVVEVVVGLLAALGLELTGTKAPALDDVLEIVAQVAEIQTLGQLFNIASEIGGTMSGLKGSSAGYWTTVRGSAHRRHARRIADYIYGATGTFFERTYGFSFGQYLKLIDAIEELLEMRVTTYSFTADPATASLSDVLALLEMTNTDLSIAAGLRPKVVQAILDRLSLAIPSDPAAKYTGPFDSSPLGQRPFVVGSSGDRYLLPIFGVAAREFVSLFDPSLMEDPKYSLARATAADDFAMKLLTQVLPGCTASTHLLYDVEDLDGVQRYEVDGIIEFEGYLILVEGKAGDISAQAQRGDVERAARDVEDIVGSAWSQVSRLRKLVTENDSTEFLDDSGEIVRTIGRHKSDRILMINPTLYSLGILGLAVPGLQQAVEFEAGREMWSISLADLYVAIEVLEDPALFLHYFQWRISLPVGTSMMVMDENDILASYLHGHYGNEPDYSEISVFVTPSTSSFDDYFAGLEDDGPPAPKPHRNLGPSVERRLKDLLRDRPRKWLQQSLALLDLTGGGAAVLEHMIMTGPSEEVGPREFMIGEAGKVKVVLIGAHDTADSLYFSFRSEVVSARSYIVVQVEGDKVRIVWSDRLQ